MTPNLLDELEGVVRLMDAATPGPWLYRPKSNSWHKPPPEGANYSYGEFILGMDSDSEDDGNGHDEAFLIAAVQFMSTHAPALADMAKRMEAAEREAADARRYRWLRAKRTKEELDVVMHDEGECLDAAIDATQEGEG